MIISLLWGNPNNTHSSIILLSSCISQLLIDSHQSNQWDQHCLTWSHFSKILGRLSIYIYIYHCQKYTCYSLWFLCYIATGYRIWYCVLSRSYHSLTHWLTDSLTHSPIHSLTHSFTHSLIHLLSHSLTYFPTYSLSHSLTHLLNHFLTHEPTHSFTFPLTHSFTFPTHSLSFVVIYSCSWYIIIFCHPASPNVIIVVWVA